MRWFWVGLTPALLVFFVRRHVKEPPVFAQTQNNLAAAAKKANFLEIFSPSILKTTILTCLLSTGAQGGYYAITTWLPTFLRTERKLTILGTGGYLAVIIIGSRVGGCVSAWLSDRLGRSPWLIPAPAPTLRPFLSLAGRPELYEQLTGSLVVDASALRRVGWRPSTETAAGLADLMRT